MTHSIYCMIHRYSNPCLAKWMPYSFFPSALWEFFNLLLITNLVQCIVEFLNTWDIQHYASRFKMTSSSSSTLYCHLGMILLQPKNPYSTLWILLASIISP